MIVISRERLKFLLAGRELDIELDRMPARPYRKHHIYAVGVSHRRGTCHAEVLEIRETENGVTLRIKQAGVDPTYFLGRGRGSDDRGYITTHDPFDAGAVPPKSATKLMAIDARERFAQARARDQKWQRIRTLTIRLRAAYRAEDVEAVTEISRELDKWRREAA